mgnify:FL=1
MSKLSSILVCWSCPLVLGYYSLPSMMLFTNKIKARPRAMTFRWYTRVYFSIVRKPSTSTFPTILLHYIHKWWLWHCVFACYLFKHVEYTHMSHFNVENNLSNRKNETWNTTLPFIVLWLLALPLKELLICMYKVLNCVHPHNTNLILIRYYPFLAWTLVIAITKTLFILKIRNNRIYQITHGAYTNAHIHTRLIWNCSRIAMSKFDVTNNCSLLCIPFTLFQCPERIIPSSLEKYMPIDLQVLWTCRLHFTLFQSKLIENKVQQSRIRDESLHYPTTNISKAIHNIIFNIYMSSSQASLGLTKLSV